MLKNVADLCHTVAVVSKSFSSFHELDTGLVKSDVIVYRPTCSLLHMFSAHLYITMWFYLKSTFLKMHLEFWNR